MNRSSEKTDSPWMASLEPPAPRLARNLKTDVVVVGAGIAGVTTAYLLARAGRKVVMLEPGPIAGGMTSRTTGHLVSAIDGRWFNLVARRGVKKARLAAASYEAAITFIADTVSAEGIACDFRRVDGMLVLADGSRSSLLSRELKACEQVGLNGVILSHQSPFPGVDNPACLRFPGQGRFHAVKYVNGLAASFLRHGGSIYCGRATNVKGGKKPVVKIGARHIEAAAVVVATNSPINGTSIHGKQAPFRTYVVAGFVPHGAVPDVLAWDTVEPYHYTRIQPLHDGKRDLVIIGGEDHKSGEANDAEVRLQRLEAWARGRFPAIDQFVFRWSGQVMETIDDLGFYGRNPGDDANVYIATGDSGIGLTHGTIAGLIISAQITGEPCPWAAIYDPARAKPKPLDPHLAKGPAPQEERTPRKDARALTPGTGAIVNRGKIKIAAYRRSDGTLSKRSAKCTHAGCTVAWNQFETCWDCPCHGSQFTAEGAVQNAPAVEPLAPVKAG